MITTQRSSQRPAIADPGPGSRPGPGHGHQTTSPADSGTGHQTTSPADPGTGHQTTTPAIAFLGTGRMGGPMAANLARAGFPVRAWDRTPSQADLAEIDQIMAAAVPVGGPTPEGMS